jgi:hypothetical protein
MYNGNLWKHRRYQHGKKHGPSLRWTFHSDRIVECNYLRGDLHGEYKNHYDIHVNNSYRYYYKGKLIFEASIRYVVGGGYKNWHTPGGSMIEYSGLTHYVLAKLILEDGIVAGDIYTREQVKLYSDLYTHARVPKNFEYTFEGVIYGYQPAIYIASRDKFIEVTSIEGFDRDDEEIIARVESVFDAGYDIDLYILDCAGDVVNIIEYKEREM